VELVPGVPQAFGYYHADAAEVLKNPKGRIVIDDGRRFLKRTLAKNMMSWRLTRRRHWKRRVRVSSIRPSLRFD